MNAMILEKLKEKFEAHIPQSLYYTYEELSEHLGSTPRTWETFLDLPETQRLIENKLNKYMQIDARKALHRLATSDNLHSTEVAAIKQLLENSHLLKQKSETKQHVLVTHIPNPSSPSNSKGDTL